MYMWRFKSLQSMETGQLTLFGLFFRDVLVVVKLVCFLKKGTTETSCIILDQENTPFN